MVTNAPKSKPTAASAAAPAAALAQEAGIRGTDISPASDSARKIVGYGLPCAKCRLYYSADLDICPTCHHHERVSPVVSRIPPKVVQPAPESAPDTAAVEQEREEFLRQFKSQLMEAHAEVANAADSFCVCDHHSGDPASAEICKACYERLQERLDLCEAALHLDIKEAAQIIYDAVWADPSDPNKTYQNAASALLAELRKRCGMNSLHGPFHPLSH
ncbi:MAG TPA: hypothetical protein VMD99_01935 [Terriglobales bacterium]|nr:hypothetical protein [Terriglobales bacterium]